MLRGEYIIDGERMIPNQFTVAGMQIILKAAFQDIRPTLYMGLCADVPADVMTLGGLKEPSAANGYARQALALDALAWPVVGTINNESYIESVAVTFPLTGPIDQAVNRLFLTDGVDVVSISSPISLLEEVLSVFSVYQYRLYFR